MNKVFSLLLIGLLVPPIHAQEPVTSKYRASLYGFIKLEAFHDNAEVAQGDWLLFVRPGGGDGQNIFSMNARHTRLGLRIKGPGFGFNGQVKGLVEIDFAGGFPNSSTAARQPNPRLRHAWVELNTAGWEARFGQDWALIAGPFPNTTSFVVGAGKGNLWMRYPQARFTVKADPVKFAFSFNRPMAGNVKYEDYAGGDFDPIGQGERSGMPWMMARFYLTFGKTTFSVSGHYGNERIDDLSESDHTLSSFSLNSDLVTTVGPLSLTLKGFIGENLNSFFGGVFQGYVREETGVSNISSRGGWGQLKATFTPAWSATVGAGFDDPNNNDIDAGMRSMNRWLFGNISFSLNEAVSFMLEAEHLKTSYLDHQPGENLRWMFVTYYRF